MGFIQRNRPWYSRAIGLVMLLGLFMVPGPSHGAEGLSELREQGIHYYRRKLYQPAIQSLEKAIELPGGKDDYRINFYLARAHYEEFLIDQALDYAKKSLKLAGTDSERNEADSFLTGLVTFYGQVRFVHGGDDLGEGGPTEGEDDGDGDGDEDGEGKGEEEEPGSVMGPGVTQGHIILEDGGSLINVQKKEAFDKISSLTAEKVVKLPYTVYLPYGEYVANGVEFEIIEEEDVPEVPIWLHPAESKGVSPWYFVGGGVAAAAVTATVVMLLVPGEEDGGGSVAIEPAAPPTQTVQFGDIRFTMSTKMFSRSGAKRGR